MDQEEKRRTEFIDTYSDDILYVLRTRDAMLTHPLNPWVDPYVSASTCRLFVYVAVGTIEAMVNDLFDKTQDPNLDRYLHQRVSNQERVEALKAFLLSRGLTCAPSIFQDFLAARLIRHEITHSAWKEDRRAQIVEAGFPEDMRKLDASHLARFGTAYQHILNALGMCMAAPNVRRIIPYEVHSEPHVFPKLSGAITFETFASLAWRYLERIASELDDAIEQAVLNERIDWTGGMGARISQERPEFAVKEAYYRALLNAGARGSETLRAKSDLAGEAVKFWRCYLTYSAQEFERSKDFLKRAVMMLAEIAKRPTPLPPLSLQGLSQQQWRDLLEAIPTFSEFPRDELARALFLGEQAYQRFPNITAVRLFSVLCPCVDFPNARVYLEWAELAADCFDLRWQWYGLIEQHGILNADNLVVYRNIRAAVEGMLGRGTGL
jgi:hypothetical protein